MSTIGNVSLLSPSSSTSTAASTSKPSQALTQQDFLKIMVAQFTQQDPLSSGGDGGGDSGTSSYVTQLMSMTNLTTLQGMSAQQGIQLADTLPGANITLNANDTNITGVVSQTSIDSSGGVDFTVNGTSYPSSDLVSVNQTAAQVAAATAAANAAATTTPTTTPTTSN